MVSHKNPFKVSPPSFSASGAAECGDFYILWELLTANWRLLPGLSPLECAVTGKHRVLPGFGRSCPPVTPLECAVTKSRPLTPLECAVTKKGGGRAMSSRFSNFEFPTSHALADADPIGGIRCSSTGDGTQFTHHVPGFFRICKRGLLPLAPPPPFA